METPFEYRVTITDCATQEVVFTSAGTLEGCLAAKSIYAKMDAGKVHATIERERGR